MKYFNFINPRLVTAAAVIIAVCIGLLFTAIFNQATSQHFSDDLLKRVSEKYGPDASKRLVALGDMVEANRNLGDKEKIKVVNDFFNQIPYYTDLDHWKAEDYWATPIEKLSTNGGDCEDYSISKYYTLRELGVEEKKLRIMYVKALEWKEAHMVLAYYSEPSLPPFVLDNIKKDLLPANERKDLVPVFSFNANGLYLAKAQGTGKRVGGPEKMKLWSNMMKRMDGSEI